MIRTFLASPWLPLVYWTAVLVAIICGTHHESPKPRPSNHQLQMVLGSSAPAPAQIPDGAATPQQHPSKQGFRAACQPAHFWYPQCSVWQKSDFSSQKLLTPGVTEKAISTEAQFAVSPPVTMLSIRVDPVQNDVSKTLAIQCRTTVAFSNERGRTVTIHGVVTQEVVSSTGKILIMAGSRVVGSGRLDLENGRFKSDGRWSIFFDDTELKVQAQLLDRPEGLPGILGQESLNEDKALRREALITDGRSIVVPRNAPFVLEIHGEIQLRDLKSNEASND